ncbi:MAG: DNA adenine methylase [Muribaculaceae bacterium]
MIKDKLIAKPFIKWVGGKGKLLSSIDTFLPYNLEKIDNLTYIEPFIGGGAMLFYMLQKYPNIKTAVINDMNKDLVMAYNVVKEHAGALIHELKQIQTEYLKLNEELRKLFYLDKRKLFNTKQLSDIDNTAYFIFLNKTCFNGLYRVNSKGAFNVPFGKYANPTICDEYTIYSDSELLQKVEITCGDFEVTEKYARDLSLFYFDPPYRPLSSTSSFNSYTKEAFGDEEQVRLRDFCIRMSKKKHLLMLSNSDCAGKNADDVFFDELYIDFFIDRVLASRSINANPQGRGKLTELLIRNYAKTKQCRDVVELKKELLLDIVH